MKIIGRGAIYRNEIPFFWKETETAIFRGWLRRKLKTLVSKLLFWYDCWHFLILSNNFFNKQEVKKRKKQRVKCPIHRVPFELCTRKNVGDVFVFNRFYGFMQQRPGRAFTEFIRFQNREQEFPIVNLHNSLKGTAEYWA